MAKKHSPIHPGAFLSELLAELDITQAQLARAIGISPMRISYVVKGARPVTADIALRLGRYFGQSAQYWLNLQARYDLDCALDAKGRTGCRRFIRSRRDGCGNTLAPNCEGSGRNNGV